MIWRTPARLQSLRLRWRGIGLTVAAMVLLPLVGLGLGLGIKAWLQISGVHSLLGVQIYALGLAVSPILSWLGYMICLPATCLLIRRNTGGVLPVTTLGAAVGAVLTHIWNEPPHPWTIDTFIISVGAAIGATCMAAWWTLAMLLPGAVRGEQNKSKDST